MGCDGHDLSDPNRTSRIFRGLKLDWRFGLSHRGSFHGLYSFSHDFCSDFCWRRSPRSKIRTNLAPTHWNHCETTQLENQGLNREVSGSNQPNLKLDESTWVSQSSETDLISPSQLDRLEPGQTNFWLTCLWPYPGRSDIDIRLVVDVIKAWYLFFFFFFKMVLKKKTG